MRRRPSTPRGRGAPGAGRAQLAPTRAARRRPRGLRPSLLLPFFPPSRLLFTAISQDFGAVLWGLGVFRRHPRLGRGAPGRSVRCSPASAPARGPAGHPDTVPAGGWVDGQTDKTDGWMDGWTPLSSPLSQSPRLRACARCPGSGGSSRPGGAVWSLGAVYPALLQRGAVGKETRIKNTVSFQCAFPPLFFED